MIVIAINDRSTYLNYAPAADRNKSSIWQVLSTYLPEDERVLEIASGSGQHALYFCEQNTRLYWQCSELSENRDSLTINLNTLGDGRFPRPITLDVLNERLCASVRSLPLFDCVYTANSFHIMSWEACLQSLKLTTDVLSPSGLFIIYGPFTYNDRPTTDSNLEFDQWLKQRNPLSGLRLFDAVREECERLGLSLVQDNDMPANNRLLVFRKGH